MNEKTFFMPIRLSSVVSSSTHTPMTIGDTRMVLTLSGRKLYRFGIRVLMAKNTLRKMVKMRLSSNTHSISAEKPPAMI